MLGGIFLLCQPPVCSALALLGTCTNSFQNVVFGFQSVVCSSYFYSRCRVVFALQTPIWRRLSSRCPAFEPSRCPPTLLSNRQTTLLRQTTRSIQQAHSVQ